MIVRFVRDSIRRSPKRKALIIAAIALGTPGGCNPIPLDNHIDGDTIVINEPAFARGVRIFRL